MNNSTSSAIFPFATQFPQFFNQNLTDTNRVLKVVKGRQCWVRVFYFQLFKLIFEADLEQQKINDLKQILISSANHALANVESEQKRWKLKQSINTVEVFIKNLTNNSELQFQNFINQNQYIDQALIDIFQQIINQTIYKDQDIYEKLKFLGELFNETMNFFEMGIKYEQSDIFIYIESNEQLYLAYLNLSSFQKVYDIQQKQINSQQNNRIQISQNQQKLIPITQVNPLQIQIKESPVQYLFTQKFRQQSTKDQKIKVQQNTIIENQGIQQNENTNNNKNIMQFTLGVCRQNQQFESPAQANMQKQQNKQTKQDYLRDEIRRQQSIVESYNQPEALRPHKKYIHLQVQPSNNKQDIFYKPSQQIAARNIVNNNKFNTKNPLDCVNDSQKGTFYRKFTNTRILNLISEPHRTKVKMLKSRFIGVHSKINKLQ